MGFLPCLLRLILIFYFVMDWERYEKAKQWAGDLKPSMKRRRIGHDYKSRCIYMITLVLRDTGICSEQSLVMVCRSKQGWNAADWEKL